MKQRSTAIVIFIFFTVGLLLGPISTVAAEQPAKGTVIDADNWKQYKEYIPLSMSTQIKRGTQFTVGGDATKFIQWSSGFEKATQKYKGKSKIGDDGVMTGWVAGVPFPEVDKEDPDVAIKIAYNLARRYQGDDQSLEKYHLITVAEDGTERITEGHSNSWRWLNVKGRTDGKPLGEWGPNPKDVWRYNTLTIDAPYDLKGTMRLLIRYDDPRKDDDIWMYIPTMRRIRRMSGAAQRQNNFGGTVATYDDIRGFQGRPFEYNWELVDEREVLCTALPNKTPIDRNEAGLWDAEVTIRDCWVVDAVPKDESYVYAKRRFFIDKENYVPWHEIVYDAQGREWKVYQNFNAPIRIGPDAEGELCVSEQSFLWIDLLTHNYTLLEYIGWNEEGEQTGKMSCGLEKDWFSVGTLRKRGRRY